MDPDPSSARRYCGVCGYLSSEPVSACPRCSQASSQIPQPTPAPSYPTPGWQPAPAGRSPPAWIVVALILAVAVITVLVALAVDGVFGPSAVLLSLVARASSLLPPR